MVRWRRDETYTGGRIADFGDPWIDLGAWEFATFAGFGALGNFDLDFVSVDEIFASHSKSARGDLFDRGAFAVTVCHRDETFWVFTPFTGI